MLGLSFLPVHHQNCPPLADLMDEEARAWHAELAWDFTPIRRILTSYLAQKLLPGYAALIDNKPIGYTYFLVHQRKGVIGTVYVSPLPDAREVSEELLELAIQALKSSEGMRRIEAQILALNGLNLAPAFARDEFQIYPRCYLQLDLAAYPWGQQYPVQEKISPWDSAYIPHLAEMTTLGYRNQVDALICEDYCSQAGCEGYLHSLVDNPGCGVFLPEASFAGIDNRGLPCGYVICSRISEKAGMIPQISIAPSHQGRGLGKALIDRALCSFKARGFHTVSLTVTKKNRRAFEWYLRTGFKKRKEFSACVWTRQ